MNSSSKLSYAIAAILSGSAVGAAHAQTAPASAPGAGTSDQIQTITVTAQRRTENAQDVPITIQALTADTLQKLNIATFDDFVKYLPNVSSPTNGPGQTSIYMRGLSVGSAGTQSSGSIGGFPNVAVYLDDQSGQLPARNLDIYAADIQRIEVLEGPQGTLFGGGAQAGVIRYITNKPKIDVTEGNAQASYGTTAHGDPNSALTAVLNLPLIQHRLALRAVIYSDRRGGYIDNVPSTFTRQPTDLGIYYAKYATGCTVGTPVNGVCAAGSPSAYGVPPSATPINNNAIAGRAINPVTYKGGRLSGLYQVNDDWSVLIEQSYQNLDAEGVFYQMPHGSDGQALNRLQVTLFNPAYDKDKFENTAWTVNGKIGDLKAVYTGGFLDRHVDQVQDYTNYSRGVYADYYQCYGPGTGYAVNGGAGDPNLTSTCFSPSATWRELERNTHMSHEFRLSTPDNWRFRAIGGAFWEDQEIYDQTDWSYKSIPACTLAGQAACMSNIAPAPGASVENPNTRNDNTAFFEDVRRGVKQYAFFTSMDFDLIPKVLTLTAGTRFFHYKEDERGSVDSSFYCFEQGPAPCTNAATNLNGENLNRSFHGFKSRGNLSWHITPDVLVYYTWSQGYRPGGFNRTSTCHIKDASGINQFCIPIFYTSDTLTNNEIGWKTEFFDHRVQFNGAVYRENWDNVQTGFFDPGALGNLTFGTNGQNFRIRGVETSIIARVTHALTLQGSASWNSSEQTNSPYLIANNPALLANPATAGEFGQPITSIPNPYGPIGSPSADSPPIQFNMRARYEWMMNEYDLFWQVGAAHTGHSYSQTSNQPSLVGTGINTTLLRFEMPAYTTYDAALGASKDAWDVQVYGSNLANSNASVFTSTAQFIVTQSVVRPRVIGVKFGYKF